MSTAGEIAHAHHAIDYIEIAVTDIDVAKAFYASAFVCSGASRRARIS